MEMGIESGGDFPRGGKKGGFPLSFQEKEGGDIIGTSPCVQQKKEEGEFQECTSILLLLLLFSLQGGLWQSNYATGKGGGRGEGGGISLRPFRPSERNQLSFWAL